MKKNMRLYKMGVFFRKFILYFILLFFALLWLIPFFFLVMGSFKSTSELFQVPFRWLPKHFDFDNYINMFQQIPFLRYLKNTLIIVFFSVVGALISNSLIAYGFSRVRWPGRDKAVSYTQLDVYKRQLKIPRGQLRAGSSPATSIPQILENQGFGEFFLLT